MPLYDYLCAACGPFAETRPMAESATPRPCPGCGAGAPRALLAAPRLSALSPERSRAHAVNERSAHAPRSARGSGCCSTKSRAPAPSAGAARSFPGRRPWMLSH